MATSVMGGILTKWANKFLLILKFRKDNYGTEIKRLQSITTIIVGLAGWLIKFIGC